MQDQYSLRQDILKQRKKLTKTTIANNSAIISSYLAELPEFQNSQLIGAYLPLAGEIDTKAIISLCWELGKKCYIPKIKPNYQLQFCRYEKHTPLQLNSQGIAEPKSAETVLPEQLDLVLVPVVVFDARGHRIGFGAGYYDRCFAFLLHKTLNTPRLIGLAHSFQEVKTITPNVWDVPLNEIITEKSIFKSYNILRPS